MKKILYTTIITLLFSLNLKSQIIIVDPYIEYDLALGIDYQANDLRYYKDFNGNLDPFIGIWKNTTGNKTFKVTLWKKKMDNWVNFYLDVIYGDYIMIENEGQANENVLFTSKIMVGSTGPWSPGFNLNGVFPALSGTLFDNTAFTSAFPYVNNMRLYFKIESNGTTAHWVLKDKREFNIIGYSGSPLPFDIILTKQ